MIKQHKKIAVRGKTVRLPAAEVNGRTVIVAGRFVRIASIHDAALAEGETVPDPSDFVAKLAASGLRADILTFSQKIHDHTPKHAYPFEWDNAAVACTSNYTEWWEGLPQVVRKNVRRSAKRGVSVEVAPFDEALVRGIKAIYDETPFRQGRRFWHFGKDLETVRADNSSYLDRSDFIGAYLDGELIGFMKIVYVDNVAMVMQILAKASHYDKRPMNALIAKAVEVCHDKGMAYLVYSKFTYGKKTESDIAEFKRRNGFAQMNFPKYFLPLTLRGRLALALKLHRGLVELLPSRMIHVLLGVRSRLLDLVATGRAWSGQIPAKGPAAVAESSDIL
jgi:hypothetical protein